MTHHELVAYAQNLPRGTVPIIDSYQELKDDLLMEITEREGQKLERPTVKFVNHKNTNQKFQDTIALASYPRSGNTLLRAYLEKIMGLATGSDGDISRKLIKDLFERGFVGEGLAGKRV